MNNSTCARRAALRLVAVPLALAGALSAFAQTQPQAQASGQSAGPLEELTVTGTLNRARNGIETQLGASTYTVTSQSIDNQPAGPNTQMNQVILQAPSVAQDSFGQMHIRGDHNGLQYRINDVILPEGLSNFGQILDPRLISSVKLITGALPAEYGLVTGGIIDISTKNGALQPGGDVSLYGGSHGQIEPSVSYGGSSGSFNYFVSGDFTRDNLGIESPDGSANPVHDRTTQTHGFTYFEKNLNDKSRLSFVAGSSNDYFQIPNTPGLAPQLGFSVNGETDYPSARLDETQREITRFGIVTYLHDGKSFDFQVSGLARYSSLHFSPDPIGDLLYDGIAQRALKEDRSGGVQAEGAYYPGTMHTLRGGILIKTDQTSSDTSSLVLPVDANTMQASGVPITIIDNGAQTGHTYSAYLQDAWTPVTELTVNYGLRYDHYSAFSSSSQLSPRVNVVWRPSDGTTTVHAGIARYFSPPPFELVASESVAKFAGTSAAAPGTVSDTPVAEKATYYDVGASRHISANATFGVDTYYKVSRDLIDEGQFGAPIILTPFNYAKGKQYGIEFTANYRNGGFAAYANLALARALGKDIVTSQFQFDPADLAYIATHYIHLDHDQAVTASGGVSYAWGAERVSMDLLYGSGLRADGAVPNGAHVPPYTQVNLGASRTFGSNADLSLRVDVINLFDEKYQIRDGSGIGVGAPQWGPRRGVFVGFSKTFARR